MSERDGGPAFPSLEKTEQYDGELARYVEQFHPEGGMTLRDYFAAQCICEFIRGAMRVVAEHPEVTALDVIAQASYDIADAMLKVRAK